MTHIAIAFTTTGDKPTKGDYISALLALRINDKGGEADRLHLELGYGTAVSERPTLAASFAALDVFIDVDPVIVHDGYTWKRFLRHGLRDQPAQRVKEVVGQTVDVADWSQRTYPRQRKDMASLLKRLNLTVDGKTIGLERDVLALVKIAPVVMKDGIQKAVTPAANPELVTEQKQEDVPRVIDVKAYVPFSTRLRLAWNVLVGAQ